LKEINPSESANLGIEVYIENCAVIPAPLEYQMPLPLLGSLLDSLFKKPKWDEITALSLRNLKQHFAIAPDLCCNRL
jgi:hypothetical protein